MKSIENQTLNLPSEAPIMVLPGALLFPHALLPLYIFEPRYRAMLAHALGKDRVFCIAQPMPGIDEPEKPEDFCPVSGLGLIRACVGREDGTSHLVLQGLARVRFRGIVQHSPFRVAQIQELQSRPGDPILVERLTTQLLDLCAALPLQGVEENKRFEEQLGKVEDSGVLCDIVAHTFLKNPRHRQEVLEALDVPERLQIVTRHLKSEMS